MSGMAEIQASPPVQAAYMVNMNAECVRETDTTYKYTYRKIVCGNITLWA